MKKNVFFIVMLAGMLSFAFSAEKGLILNVPSALAGDSEDSKGSKDRDSKDKDSKDQGSKDSNSDSGNNHSGNDSGSCACSPGIASCKCADGSTGAPGTGSSHITPNSMRSVHGN